MEGVVNMDCKLILAAVYATAAVVSMTVTVCSVIETKKILGQIEKQLSKNKDTGNDVFITDGTGTEYQGRGCRCTGCTKKQH